MTATGRWANHWSLVAGAACWLVLVGGGTARAREDLVPGSLYTSARGSAMGDAFLPLADDAGSALFYNPAGLAYPKKGRHSSNATLEPLNVLLYAGSGYLGQANVMSPSTLNAMSLRSITSTLEANPGQYTSMGYSLLPSFQYKGLGIGLLYQSQAGAIANGNGTISYRSTYQMIPTAGYGISLAHGLIRIGYSVQWIQQAGVPLTTVAQGTAASFSQGIYQGSAISHTIGYAMTLPFRNSPQFDLVARNIGGLHYSGWALTQFTSSSLGPPPDQAASYDASMSFVHKMGRRNKLNVVMEYRDITDTSNVPVQGRVAAGMEYIVHDTVSLRGGYGSGYPSAGIGITNPRGELDLTYMSEDVGTTYHALRDTRYVMQYQLRAF